jgi:peptide/nickel transport system substrate-binding protein
VDGFFGEPSRLIPNTDFILWSIAVDEAIFSPLFYTDARGVLHPGLAAAIPTLANGGISRDGLTYTFRLRPGLSWSDGAPLDARDVDFSWRTWMSKGLIVASTAGFDHIKSADVSPDNLSITFHLTSPYAPFIAAWVDQVMPLPRHTLAALTPQQLNTSAFTQQPTVASGPFVMAARAQGESITLVRNPRYYRAAEGLPYLDKVVIRIIPDQTAITNALRAHEIDAAWFLDVAQFTTYQHIPGYTLLATSGPNYEQGLLNLRNPILADVRVRRALEYGLDRGAMATDVWHGTALLLGSDVAPTSFAYSPLVKPYPFDPVKAGQLLDAAGWKLGSDGRRHKHGQTLTLRYSTTARNTWRAQDELIALQDYQNLGIDLRIINYPSSTLFGSIFPNGDFDIAEWENSLTYDPDIVIASYFKGNQVPPAGSNYGYYRSASYDALITQEETATNPARRLAIFARMQQQMHDDLPALWLYDPPVLSVHANTVHNYAPGPLSNETWNIWQWWKGS